MEEMSDKQTVNKKKFSAPMSTTHSMLKSAQTGKALNTTKIDLAYFEFENEIKYGRRPF